MTTTTVRGLVRCAWFSVLLPCMVGGVLIGCVTERVRGAPGARVASAAASDIDATDIIDTNDVPWFPSLEPGQPMPINATTLVENVSLSGPAASPLPPAEKATVVGRVRRMGPFAATHAGEGKWLLLGSNASGDTLVHLPPDLAVLAVTLHINVGSRVTATGVWAARDGRTYLSAAGIAKE